jgi:hypothetical protein
MKNVTMITITLLFLINSGPAQSARNSTRMLTLGYASAPAVHVGSDFRKMNVAACTLKAVEAMGIQQHFIHAEINGPDAWGYDENSFVMVHAVPISDGVEIFVVAFSASSQEAARLRNAIREHVFDGPFNSRISKTYQTFDTNRRQGPLAVHWGNFNKVATEKTFRACAVSAMAGNGLHGSASGNQIIFGTSSAATAVALGVGLPSATQVLVLAASTDSTKAAWLRNGVRTSILGCISFD